MCNVIYIYVNTYNVAATVQWLGVELGSHEVAK